MSDKLKYDKRLGSDKLSSSREVSLRVVRERASVAERKCRGCVLNKDLITN